ncbi:MAG: hypothetical protein RBT19_03760 [Tenuifilaceae bacterium]|jgi:hypothetical protein|nr:hypothetical protein [Tenuifilaceae bacterium]
MKRSKMKPSIYRLSAFPLNLILLPGEEIPLRIFEPRYKQLITECLETKQSFGIPFLGENGMTEIGSEVVVTKLVGRNANEDMVISIKGISLYKTIDFFPVLPDKLYGGTVSELLSIDFSTTNPEVAVRVKALKLNLSNELGTLIVSDSINMLDIARSLMLKSEEKYKLLTLTSKVDKEQFIINQLRFMELIRSQETKLENNFSLN